MHNFVPTQVGAIRTDRIMYWNAKGLFCPNRISYYVNLLHRCKDSGWKGWKTAYSLKLCPTSSAHHRFNLNSVITIIPTNDIRLLKKHYYHYSDKNSCGRIKKPIMIHAEITKDNVFDADHLRVYYSFRWYPHLSSYDILHINNFKSHKHKKKFMFFPSTISHHDSHNTRVFTISNSIPMHILHPPPVIRLRWFYVRTAYICACISPKFANQCIC